MACVERKYELRLRRTSHVVQVSLSPTWQGLQLPAPQLPSPLPWVWEMVILQPERTSMILRSVYTDRMNPSCKIPSPQIDMGWTSFICRFWPEISLRLSASGSVNGHEVSLLRIRQRGKTCSPCHECIRCVGTRNAHLCLSLFPSGFSHDR